MKLDLTVREDVAAKALLDLTITAANAMFMDVCNQAPHRLPKMHDQTSLLDHWLTFPDGVGIVLLAFLPIQTTNIIIMYNHHQIASQLPDWYGQKSLMLCGCSIPDWGRERVAFSFAEKGGQSIHYDYLHWITLWLPELIVQKLLTPLRLMCNSQ